MRWSRGALGGLGLRSRLPSPELSIELQLLAVKTATKMAVRAAFSSTFTALKKWLAVCAYSFELTFLLVGVRSVDVNLRTTEQGKCATSPTTATSMCTAT